MQRYRQFKLLQQCLTVQPCSLDTAETEINGHENVSESEITEYSYKCRNTDSNLNIWLMFFECDKMQNNSVINNNHIFCQSTMLSMRV